MFSSVGAAIILPNTQPRSFLKAYNRPLLQRLCDVSAIPLLQTDRPSGLNNRYLSLPTAHAVAAVVTPRWGVFVMPVREQHNSNPLRKRWEASARCYQAPEGRHKLLYNTKNNCQKPYVTDASYRSDHAPCPSLLRKVVL